MIDANAIITQDIEHSVAIYKHVLNYKDQYKSVLQLVIRTTPDINFDKCFTIQCTCDGQLLKPMCITTEDVLHFVLPVFEKDEEYFMVISDNQDLKFPIETNWHHLDDTSNHNDFDNSEICIIKEMIPNSDYWKDLWKFLNMEV